MEHTGIGRGRLKAFVSIVETFAIMVFLCLAPYHASLFAQSQETKEAIRKMAKSLERVDSIPNLREGTSDAELEKNALELIKYAEQKALKFKFDQKHLLSDEPFCHIHKAFRIVTENAYKRGDLKACVEAFKRAEANNWWPFHGQLSFFGDKGREGAYSRSDRRSTYCDHRFLSVYKLVNGEAALEDYHKVVEDQIGLGNPELALDLISQVNDRLHQNDGGRLFAEKINILIKLGRREEALETYDQAKAVFLSRFAGLKSSDRTHYCNKLFWKFMHGITENDLEELRTKIGADPKEAQASDEGGESAQGTSDTEQAAAQAANDILARAMENEAEGNRWAAEGNHEEAAKAFERAREAFNEAKDYDSRSRLAGLRNAQEALIENPSADSGNDAAMSDADRSKLRRQAMNAIKVSSPDAISLCNEYIEACKADPKLLQDAWLMLYLAAQGIGDSELTSQIRTEQFSDPDVAAKLNEMLDAISQEILNEETSEIAVSQPVQEESSGNDGDTNSEVGANGDGRIEDAPKDGANQEPVEPPSSTAPTVNVNVNVDVNVAAPAEPVPASGKKQPVNLSSQGDRPLGDGGNDESKRLINEVTNSFTR